MPILLHPPHPSQTLAHRWFLPLGSPPPGPPPSHPILSLPPILHPRRSTPTYEKPGQYFEKFEEVPEERKEEVEEAHREPLIANNMINTNDCDGKGRCVHHPHIRLRKKQMFGRGWKVLMSACSDCCVDELRRIRLVEENNKRRMKSKLDKLERSERSGCGNLDDGSRRGSTHSVDSHHSGSQYQEQPRTEQPVYSSLRSGGSHHARSPSAEPQVYSSLRSGGSHHDQKMQQEAQLRSSVRSNGSRSAVPPPPPRSQKRSPSQDSYQTPKRAPSQESHKSSSRRAPSQESYRYAPAPKNGRSPSQESLNKRSPSQESFRDVSVNLTNAHRDRRSPSIGEDRRQSSKDRLQSSDDATASLTGSEPISDRSPNLVAVNLPDAQKKKKKSSRSSSSRSKSKDPQEDLDASEQTRGTIHVREMQWTDNKGQSGTYTGQVNDRFVPSGHSKLEYEDGHIKEGAWKNGWYRKNKNRSRSKSRDRSSSRRERSSSRSRRSQLIPAAA